MKLYPAAAVDVICVVLFALVGRSSHGESTSLAGVLETAWPFLAGVVVGLLLSRPWRQPDGVRTGVLVWLSTVVVGMLLRVASGSTAQVSFVIVAGVVLAVLLVGWRVGHRLVQRARSRRSDRARA